MLNVRIRRKRNYNDETKEVIRKAEYLVKWNHIGYEELNPKKWVLGSDYPNDSQSKAALEKFNLENTEKRISVEKLDEIDEKENHAPGSKRPKINEPESIREPPKQPEKPKTEAKIGHAINKEENFVKPVELPEAPKRTGATFEYDTTIGYRIVKLSDHELDIQILIRPKNRSETPQRKPFWISIYAFDVSFRRQFSPIITKAKHINNVIRVYSAGTTFILEVKLQGVTKPIFVEEDNFFTEFIQLDRRKDTRGMDSQHQSI